MFYVTTCSTQQPQQKHSQLHVCGVLWPLGHWNWYQLPNLKKCHFHTKFRKSRWDGFQEKCKCSCFAPFILCIYLSFPYSHFILASITNAQVTKKQQQFVHDHIYNSLNITITACLTSVTSKLYHRRQLWCRPFHHHSVQVRTAGLTVKAPWIRSWGHFHVNTLFHTLSVALTLIVSQSSLTLIISQSLLTLVISQSSLTLIISQSSLTLIISQSSLTMVIS